MMTVTGAKTGLRYTTPVQYLEHDDEFVVLSQRMREWWRNIAFRPEVGMRIQGRSITGRARIASDDEAASILSDCLSEDPRIAKFYGIANRSDGTPDATDVERLLDRVVVIAVTVPTMEPEFTAEDIAVSMR
jgi:deazaflavin-dependent oxidoreductase (nitroreductase family)